MVQVREWEVLSRTKDLLASTEMHKRNSLDLVYQD